MMIAAIVSIIGSQTKGSLRNKTISVGVKALFFTENSTVRSSKRLLNCASPPPEIRTKECSIKEWRFRK